MVVIAHLAIGMDDPVEADAYGGQYIPPIRAIFVAQKNVFAMIPSGGDMVKCSREFKSEWSGHFEIIAGNVGMLELTPFFTDPIFYPLTPIRKP